MKRPWNLASLPVFSLVTPQGASFNMNICTYVSAVSMQPKQYMVALYHPSQSYRNMLQSNEAVLQLLHLSQAGLVQVLGKTSGAATPKCEVPRIKKHLHLWKNFPVLKDASAVLHLKKKEVHPCNDHSLFLFDVLAYRSLNASYLDTKLLGDKKIIRI